MEKQKVIIVVQGGKPEIYSTDPNIEVTIINKDQMAAGDLPEFILDNFQSVIHEIESGYYHKLN